MRRIIALGLASALGAVALAIPANAQTTTKFSVFAIEVAGHRVDNNTFTFRDRLVQPGNRSNVLGHDEGRCSQVNRRTVHCRTVFFFPNGKVKVKGDVNFGRDRDRLPVIGGTGAYNGVAGKVIVEPRDRNTLLHFTLVK